MSKCNERDRLKREFERATVAYSTEDIRMQSASFPIEEFAEQEERVENANRKLQAAVLALNEHTATHGCAIGE